MTPAVAVIAVEVIAEEEGVVVINNMNKHYVFVID
jgi:hypothetical protein